MKNLKKLSSIHLKKIYGGMGPIELFGYITGYVSSAPRFNPLSYSFYIKKKR